MEVEDYVRSVATAVRTTFLTARAAARHMTKQRPGHPRVRRLGKPMRDCYVGGTQLAFEAIESMRRQLAAELGPHASGS